MAAPVGSVGLAADGIPDGQGFISEHAAGLPGLLAWFTEIIVGTPNIGSANIITWLAWRTTGYACGMIAADSAVPALLREKPTWLISQVSAHAHRLLTERLATAGARGYHFRLLAALEEFGPASQAKLGRRTEMDRSDVTAALNELTDQKLAERTADHADRRRNIITITASGRAHLRRLDALLADVQNDLLEPLTRAERQALTGMLTRILDYHASSQAPDAGEADHRGARK
jgi:MarR family transcriptional regulator, lower aerobic nicotinate degradation pathway regulator